MLRNTLVATSLIAGIALMLLGATWSYWHSPQMLWSQDQANEYTDAWRTLKVAATSGPRRGDPTTNPKLAAAQARFDAINAKLEHAKVMNTYAGTILMTIGAIMSAVSTWLYFSRDPATSSAAA